MKHLFLAMPMTLAGLLLSGCPDTNKLPTPSVPQPKAQTSAKTLLPAQGVLMADCQLVPAASASQA